ncbi:MAG: ATP-binding protein [Ardenticatenaceae bacterium]
MPNLVTRFYSLLERALPGLVFVLLGLWTYALFVHVPYAGFDFNPSDGEVTVVYDDASPDAALQVGDRLRQVGATTWETFRNDLGQSFFVNKQPGQVVPLQIQRGTQELSLNWVYPGFTFAQFGARLNSEWWLAYVFWLVGTATWLFLRPKDERQRLLVAFYFLTAIWLAGGSTLSRWHIWGGSIKLGALVWPCVPLYLHLHWILPRSLGTIPPAVWRFAYLVAGSLAVGEFFQLIPQKSYFLGFLVAVGGSVCLQLLHFVRQPEQRREIMLLAAAAALAFLPAVAVGIVGLASRIPTYAGLGILSTPALPLGYFYAAARRQLGELELRANRLISLYVFMILLGTSTLIVVPLAQAWLSQAGEPIGLILAAVLLATLIAVMGFAPFERWIERHLLGMPLAPTHLLEDYATHITTTLELPSLVSLLESQILPTLLVRQAVLLKIDERGRGSVLSAMGLDDEQLPTERNVPELLEQMGHRRTSEPLVASCPWVRVILPLQIGEETIGLWLLGRRDPDDFYAQAEIATLQAIANQTAIALTNIVQAKRLRVVHQTSIEREEWERTRLARDLHDVVLNQLAVLYISAENEDLSRFDDNYHNLAEYVRQLVKGLRPAMLSYGLRTALDELVDDLAERQEEELAWELDLSTEDMRYPPSVEQHLFRIVQQACENALRHAQAGTIHLTSRFRPTQVKLTVKDDGIGFEAGEVLDLTYLLDHRHFGIVGMLERAELIGATIRIESKPNHGTQVSVSWQSPQIE